MRPNANVDFRMAPLLTHMRGYDGDDESTQEKNTVSSNLIHQLQCERGVISQQVAIETQSIGRREPRKDEVTDRSETS